MTLGDQPEDQQVVRLIGLRNEPGGIEHEVLSRGVQTKVRRQPSTPAPSPVYH